ncbi:translocation/assembly module TamB, partial [Corallococcus exiguus]|nr:translocation/assembly module TamB [Corallococcus exiguus]
MSLPSRNSAARKALLLVLLVVSGSILLLRQPFTWDAACTLARRQLPDLLGVGIGIGRCELDPLGSRVVLHGVSVFAPGRDTPLFAADEAEVGLGFLSPLSRRFMLGHVRVRHPRVALDLSRPSSAPPSSDGTCPLTPLTRVGVGRVDITGAEVRLALPDGRGVEVEN